MKDKLVGQNRYLISILGLEKHAVGSHETRTTRVKGLAIQLVHNHKNFQDLLVWACPYIFTPLVFTIDVIYAFTNRN